MSWSLVFTPCRHGIYRREPALPSSVFVVDRTTCMSRPILVETIRCYLEQDAVVQIVDGTMPPGDRFRYGVQMVDRNSSRF